MDPGSIYSIFIPPTLFHKKYAKILRISNLKIHEIKLQQTGPGLVDYYLQRMTRAGGIYTPG